MIDSCFQGFSAVSADCLRVLCGLRLLYATSFEPQRSRKKPESPLRSAFGTLLLYFYFSGDRREKIEELPSQQRHARCYEQGRQPSASIHSFMQENLRGKCVADKCQRSRRRRHQAHISPRQRE